MRIFLIIVMPFLLFGCDTDYLLYGDGEIQKQFKIGDIAEIEPNKYVFVLISENLQWIDGLASLNPNNMDNMMRTKNTDIIVYTINESRTLKKVDTIKINGEVVRRNSTGNIKNVYFGFCKNDTNLKLKVGEYLYNISSEENTNYEFTRTGSCKLFERYKKPKNIYIASGRKELVIGESSVKYDFKIKLGQRNNKYSLMKVTAEK